MPIKIYKLKNIKNLTNDVFEIKYEINGLEKMKSGQFVTFLLDKIGGRAYSILKQEENEITLIIKKWEIENGGRGGSKFLCEQNIGDELRGVGPSGHFLLKENSKNKMFIGTGTGIVPLYNQINGSIEQKQNAKLKLLFGVREEKDFFYIENLNNINKKYKEFEFELFTSREKIEGINKGYVTDYLTKQNINGFEEFYICGTPSMIDSCINILNSLGIEKESIFYEKF